MDCQWPRWYCRRRAPKRRNNLDSGHVRIALATEDELSEAVGSRLVAEVAPALEINLRLRRGGSGYLRSKLRNFHEMARRQPVLLITDLDRSPCPATLIAQWSRQIRRNDGLLFRVAVHEIEAWLLADHEAIGNLFGGRTRKLPERPDAIADPKRALLDLAAAAPRRIRANLRAEEGAIAAQGLGYNRTLAEWVHQKWSPERASSRSESLHRTRLRIRELADRVTQAAAQTNRQITAARK